MVSRYRLIFFRESLLYNTLSKNLTLLTKCEVPNFEFQYISFPKFVVWSIQCVCILEQKQVFIWGSGKYIGTHRSFGENKFDQLTNQNSGFIVPELQLLDPKIKIIVQQNVIYCKCKVQGQGHILTFRKKHRKK